MAGASILPVAFGTTSSEAVPESRVIIDESLSWLSSGDAARLLRRIKSAGFNVLVPFVWHGMGATWDSTLAPRIAKYPGGDPLARLCTAAKEEGIEVHPLFAVALRQREFLSQFVRLGTPDQMFEMHLPDFRDFIVSVIMEVVERYPIQGINLDYIRAGGIGTSLVGVSDYQTRTGRDLLEDRSLGTDTAMKSIVSWQTAAVGDVVRKVAAQAKRVRPGIVMSMCGNPAVPELALQGQDAIGWTNADLIDVVYNMDYRQNPDFEVLKHVRDQLSHPEALVQMVGNYESANRLLNKTAVTSRAPKLVVQLVQESRDFSLGNGICVYLYSMLSDAQVATLRNTVFARTARPQWQKRATIARAGI